MLLSVDEGAVKYFLYAEVSATVSGDWDGAPLTRLHCTAYGCESDI